MTVPADTVTSDAMVGIKEDVGDIIFNVDPEDTPFSSRTAKTSAHNTLKEWLTESLRASGDNAHVEGDDTSLNAMTPQVRLNNQCQIFKDAVGISGTDKGLQKYGRKSEMKHDILRTMKAHKLDIERAMFANQEKVARASDTPGKLAGIPTWLITNVDEADDATAPTGDGTDARVDGTPEAFSQARFDATMQSIWTNSSSGKAYTCYLNPFQMNKALSFVGNNNQRNTTGSGRVENDLIVYVTPWGSVKWQMSRECRPADVFILKDDMWKIAQLRPTKNEPLAKTGDSEKRQIVTELTLEASNEKASGAVYDNTAA